MYNNFANVHVKSRCSYLQKINKKYFCENIHARIIYCRHQIITHSCDMIYRICLDKHMFCSQRQCFKQPYLYMKWIPNHNINNEWVTVPKPTSIKLLTIREAGKETAIQKKILNEIYSPWINGKTYFFMRTILKIIY